MDIFIYLLLGLAVVAVLIFLAVSSRVGKF